MTAPTIPTQSPAESLPRPAREVAAGVGHAVTSPLRTAADVGPQSADAVGEGASSSAPARAAAAGAPVGEGAAGAPVTPPVIPAQRANHAEMLALVARAQAGDRQAFGQLYADRHAIVYRVAYAKLRNHHLAEDATAETFTRGLSRIHQWHYQGQDIAAWFVMICKNWVADYYKASYQRRVQLSDDMAYLLELNGSTAPERYYDDPSGDAVAIYLTSVALMAAMQQLIPAQRECLVLRFYRGLSVTETAHAMGKNVGAIKALQYRATRSLARLLPAAALT